VDCGSFCTYLYRKYFSSMQISEELFRSISLTKVSPYQIHLFMAAFKISLQNLWRISAHSHAKIFPTPVPRREFDSELV